MYRLAIVSLITLGFAAAPALADEPAERETAAVREAAAVAQAAKVEPAPERLSTRDRWRGRPYLRSPRQELRPEALDRMVPVFVRPVAGITPGF